jgi:hypothetical protein
MAPSQLKKIKITVGDLLLHSQSADRLPYLRALLIFPSISKQIPRQYLETDHNTSLPNNFQFTNSPVMLS